MRISDWSSDVCSSDLAIAGKSAPVAGRSARGRSARTRPTVPRRMKESGVNPGEDPRWHAALNAMRHGAKAVPDDPELMIAGMQGLADVIVQLDDALMRSEEHTSELQSLMRISSAVLCLKKQ